MVFRPDLLRGLGSSAFLALGWLPFAVGTVTIRSLRGTRVFHAGHATVRRFPVPVGLLRSGSALELVGDNGASMSMSLGLFGRRRADMVHAIDDALLSL